MNTRHLEMAGAVYQLTILFWYGAHDAAIQSSATEQQRRLGIRTFQENNRVCNPSFCHRVLVHLEDNTEGRKSEG
jgi:hypothetical protein